MKCLLLAVAASAALATPLLPADDSAVPGAGFPASRYEALWTKSPFAVATPEGGTDSSPDYFLVGIATVGGISYASVIERQSQDHYLISTDKATRGLTLTSITRGHNGSDTFAVVQKNGQSITLKLEQAPVTGPTPAGMPSTNAVATPGIITPQITMPGAGLPTGGPVHPITRLRRAPIHLPPPPGQAQPTPAPAQPQQPGGAAPATTPTTPPPAQ